MTKRLLDTVLPNGKTLGDSTREEVLVFANCLNAIGQISDDDTAVLKDHEPAVLQVLKHHYPDVAMSTLTMWCHTCPPCSD
jgi:hypothetical protein